MRESHPYRKVSERKKKKKCCLQPVFNFFEEHASLFHCDTQVAVVGVLFLYRSWPPVLRFLTACRSSICSLFSFVSFFFPPSFLQLCFSSNLPVPPPPPPPPPPPSPRPPLLNQLWPSSLSCSSVSPFFLSQVGGHTWVQYDGSSFIPPLSCLCMSLSVPIVPLLTCPCTTSPHSSFLSPLLYVAPIGLWLSPNFCQACYFIRSPLLSSLSLSTFHLHSFNSEKSYPLCRKCVSRCWLLMLKSGDLILYKIPKTKSL